MSSAARERGEHAPFGGFVTGGAAVTLPAQLFAELLPQIEDECELRVTLHALFAVARARGQLRAVRATALAPDPALAAALARLGGQPALAGALAAAVRRGTLLVCPLADGDALYFVNSEGGRRNLLRVQSGALAVPGTAPLPPPAPEPAAPVRVYESEIGALTPAVTAALAEAGGALPRAVDCGRATAGGGAQRAIVALRRGGAAALGSGREGRCGV